MELKCGKNRVPNVPNVVVAQKFFFKGLDFFAKNDPSL